MSTIGIGLAGFGTVGAGVYKNLAANRELLSQRAGVDMEIKRIAVRDPSKPRDIGLPAGTTTDNWQEVVDDPEVQVVVELMGGMDSARALFERAIRAGKPVVTGNKALIAEHGLDLFKLAAEHRVPIFYEAAAAGGIPIIKAMRESFVGNHILRMVGIINGTSNFILTRMTELGETYQEALAEAQRLGYAEADPTLDVNGWDAGHKAVILASLAYGFWVAARDIFVEGIESITAEDIRFAHLLGYHVKHLAVIQAESREQVEVRVHPAFIPNGHVLASVNGVFNAVMVEGDVVGETLFYGRGAGQDPTASAVLADMAEAAATVDGLKRRCLGFTPHQLYGRCKPIDEVVCQFYLRLDVVDQPGTLAQVANVLGSHQIGISSVIQPESHDADSVPLVLMIHDARTGDMNKARATIEALPCVKSVAALIRVENSANE